MRAVSRITGTAFLFTLNEFKANRMSFLIRSIFIISFLFSGLVSAQVVTTDPPFPSPDEPIKITFDATKGNRGLEDYNGLTFVHTGLITEFSNSETDWRYVVTEWGVLNPNWLCTQVGDNLYEFEITPSVFEYYNVPPGEKVEQIAILFRNGDGSLVGRDVDGGDIYIDLVVDDEEFLLQLNEPVNNNLLIRPGNTVDISAITSQEATYTLFENDQEIDSESGVDNYTYQYLVEGDQSVELRLEADNGEEVLMEIISIVPSRDPEVIPLPDGSILGADFLDESSVRLVLEAPGKEFVAVRGTFTDWLYNRDFIMNITPDGRYHWLEIDGLTEGEYYTYQYAVEGEIRIGDPLSELILDPDNDIFISEEIWPDLPDHPEEAAEEVVTLMKMGGLDYNWQYTDDFEPPEPRDLVVYELLIRDFIEAGSFEVLKDTLDYLERLNVNVIELMPVSEFEGNLSWGYNPYYHMALDKYYGTPDAFKDFIDEAHRRGMAVVIDVVYNHAFNDSPLARMYWDAAQNRPAADNPWLNPVPRHPFNVGNDFNHESQATVDFVDRTIKYWMEEYRVDGFRFDLSKGFTQKFSTDDSVFRLYDQNRINTLKHYADVTWSVNPNAYVILEHFAENSEEIELTDYGMMIWGNHHFNGKQAAMGYTSGGESDFSGAYYQNRGWNNPHLISYVESHDEQRLMYENQEFGNSNGSYNTQELPTAVDRIAMTSSFFYLIPGPHLFWQFAEWGYDFPINYCPNGTVIEACRTAPKPIRWDYRENQDRKRLENWFSDIFYLKLDEGLNANNIASSNLRDGVKYMTLTGSDLEAALVGNFTVSDGSISFAFPSSGTWYDYATGDSIEIESAFQTINLEPGEWHIYLNQRIVRPNRDGVTSVRDIVDPSIYGLKVFPNPSIDGSVTIQFDVDQADTVLLQITNSLGQVYWSRQLTSSEWRAGHVYMNTDFPEGIYFMNLNVDGKVATVKWIKK